MRKATVIWTRTKKVQEVSIIKREGGYYYYKIEGIDATYKVMYREWDTIKYHDEQPAETLPLLKVIL